MRVTSALALIAVILVGVTGCIQTRGFAAAKAAPEIDCGSADPIKIPNRAAPAYSGRGPHLAVAGTDLGLKPKLVAFLFTTSLPEEWQARNEQTREDDLSKAQLVACLTDVQKRDATPIGTCKWQRTVGNVYAATYTYVLYEAKTGNKLTTFTIAGDEAADQSCPWTILTGGGFSTDVAQEVKHETLIPHLEPFVMKDLG